MGLGLGLWSTLRGGHVDLLPADGVPGGLSDGFHAGDFVDDLCHVGDGGCAFDLLLGGEAVGIEFSEKDGRGDIVGCGHVCGSFDARFDLPI